MKISIVTLSYNQAQFLAEAMDSVLGQGYPELEYIVVDPGSTDGSRALIEQRAAKLACVLLEPDRGASDGLNKGFAHATGEVFGFLNADDVLYPGALETVARYFAEHPECDIVFGSGHTMDGDGKWLKHYSAGRFTVANYFYGGAVWLQQATFFRAEIFRRVQGFNVDNRTSWDGELFVRMASEGARAGYIKKDLAGFRIHGTSISGTGKLNEQYKRDCRRVFAEVRGRTWGWQDAALRWPYKAKAFLARSLERATRQA